MFSPIGTKRGKPQGVYCQTEMKNSSASSRLQLVDGRQLVTYTHCINFTYINVILLGHLLHLSSTEREKLDLFLKSALLWQVTDWAIAGLLAIDKLQVSATTSYIHNSIWTIGPMFLKVFPFGSSLLFSLLDILLPMSALTWNCSQPHSPCPLLLGFGNCNSALHWAI